MNLAPIALLFALLDDRAALDALARQFLAARASTQLNAPAVRDAFDRQQRNVIRVRCFDVEEIAPPRIAIDGSSAEIDVDVKMAGRPEIEHLVLDAKREGDAWTLTRSRKAEELLAEEIAAAKDEAARRQRLDARPELYTSALDRALNDRALGLVNQRQYEAARVLARIAGRIAADLGDRGGQSAATIVESSILRRQTDPDVPGSLALSREAVALARESNDPDMIAQASLAYGRVLMFDAPVEAERVLEQVVQLRPQLAEPRRVALAAAQIGDFYAERGDYRAALHYAEIARAVSVETGELLPQYSASMLAGIIYADENDFELAAINFKRAIETARAAKFSDGAAMGMVNLSDVYARTQRHADFLRTINEALEYGNEISTAQAFYSNLYLARGRYYVEQNDLARGESDLQKALENARAGKQKNQIGPVLSELADVRVRQHRYDDAIAFADEAITAFAADGEYEHFEPLVIAARAYRALGRRDTAYAKLKAALQMTEEQRGVLGGSERQRELFFTSRVPAYLAMIDTLIDDGRIEEALRTAEAAKGRTLLDILAGGRLMSEDLVSAEDRKREAELRAAIGAAADDAARKRARSEMDAFLATLYVKYPRLSAQRGAPARVTLAQMGALLHGERAAFIEYVVEPKRVRIFVVRNQGTKTRVGLRSVTIDRDALTKDVTRYVAEISQRYHGYRTTARSLYRLLVEPVEPLLGRASVICIVPDGPLWQLPFESLIAPTGRAVVDRFATFYAPSIAVYHQMTSAHAPATPQSFLGFAEIPGSTEPQREVRTIATLFPSREARIYTGAAAVQSRVKEEAPRFSVLHFATHGELDDSNPMYSRLVLARRTDIEGEDVLETWEMMQLYLHAQLAVLSACDTGRGIVHDGEGLIGMSWALFVAGCPSTIVSKWRVESRSTATMMIEFYRQWLHSPERPAPFAKASALRSARLRLRSDPEHRHPYYWSAFVLMGAGD